MQSHGVLVQIAGLAADNQTTVLTLRTRRGEQSARHEYQRLLIRFGDSGGAYAVQVLR